MLRVRSTYGHRLLLSIRHSMIGISIAVDSIADHGRRHAPKLSAFLERWLSEVYINHKSMKTWLEGFSCAQKIYTYVSFDVKYHQYI